MISTTNPGNHHTKYLGLSSDQKPKAKNGSFFYEMDTGILFAFDEENDDWLPSPGGGGGGGGTTVIANPELVGDEEDLTGIQIGNTKYAVPAGGSGEEVVLFKDLPYFYVDIDLQTGEEGLYCEYSVEEFRNLLNEAALQEGYLNGVLGDPFTTYLASIFMQPSTQGGVSDPNNGYLSIDTLGYYGYHIGANYTITQDDKIVFTLSSYEKRSENDEPITFDLDKENQSLSLAVPWPFLLNKTYATGNTMVYLLTQNSAQEANLYLEFSASGPDNHFEIRTVGLPAIYIDGTIGVVTTESGNIEDLEFIVENYEEQPIGGDSSVDNDWVHNISMVAQTPISPVSKIYLTNHYSDPHTTYDPEDLNAPYCAYTNSYIEFEFDSVEVPVEVYITPSDVNTLEDPIPPEWELVDYTITPGNNGYKVRIRLLGPDEMPEDVEYPGPQTINIWIYCTPNM